MKKVLIPTKLDTVAADALTANGNYAVVQEAVKDVIDLAVKHPDAYALIVRSEKVTPRVIDSLPALKVIVRAGAGHDTIDIKYARSKGVDVMNTPGANSNAVAEEVLAMMLADARHIIRADASARSGKWEKNEFMGREIAGRTVGIVGLGNVGQLVARRLVGFDVALLGFDPVISAERAAKMDVELTDLETLFTRSDYVTLHLPENEETRGLVGDRLLSLMKPGATLINCARAGVVNEEALRKAKREKKLRFLNDVYAKDTEGPKSVSDVADIMLPHLGASTFEANFVAARRAAEQLIEFDEKGIAAYIVNRDIPEGLDETYCELANTISRLSRCLIGADTKLTTIETSIYGDLQRYSDWLLVPIVAGLWPGFDRSLDYRPARDYLKGMGIDYINRETDSGKRYGESITIDLTGVLESGLLRKVSVRGTVAEGSATVSRIDAFDRLYFAPKGCTVLFKYEDRPGVIGAIGVALARERINIADIRNAYDPKTNQSLAIMKVSSPVPQDLVNKIAAEIKALTASHVEL